MKEEKIIHPINFKSRNKYYLIAGIALVLTGLSAYFGFGGIDSQSKVVPPKDKFGEILAITQTPVAYKKAPASYELPAAKWIPQTFNNCGPAATAMTLQYFGINVSQAETKNHLRTGDDDKNIFMYQISDYLKTYQIESKVLINGDRETVKTLIANGFYVVVEDWLKPDEDIGHVLIIRGYSDAEGVFIADDSYFGVGIKYPYEIWEEKQWKPYNREFMPVYRSENENTVRAIVGENWNENTMYQNAIESDLKEIASNPNDMYALFNLGSNYFAVGEYQKAKEAFEKSQSLGWPGRMLWYNIDPIKTYNKLGLYQKALDLSVKALAGNEPFAEVHLEKSIAYKGLGKTDLAEAEMKRALELDPNI